MKSFFLAIFCSFSFLSHASDLSSTAVPHFGFTIDLNGTIMQRDEIDLEKMLSYGSEQEIQDTIFPSFKNFLILMEQLAAEGKLTYHITFISYSRVAELFPLASELLQQALQKSMPMGYLDENNGVYFPNENRSISSSEEIVDFFKQHHFTVLQGNFKRWEDNGYHSIGGKPLYMDPSNNFFGIGWDDNLYVPKRGEHTFIFHPMTPTGETIPYEYVEDWATNILTIEAKENENYFIDLFMKAIKNHETNLQEEQLYGM